MDKEQYKQYVKDTAPRSPEVRTLLPAFFVGGLICAIGQAISDLLSLWLKDFEKDQIAALTSAILIFLGALLTGLGVYDKIGKFAGGGSIVPITGFANSIVSPAMEYNREGIFFGVCAKMFTIAGPIIVIGIAVSVLVGIIGMFL
ncbi:MAG TPA: stage V sporulation protein AC [Candidatus Faecicola pullistercoris]|nr:stage V sporulation protein AC [Candidatus Faecicola pullistercoris]